MAKKGQVRPARHHRQDGLECSGALAAWAHSLGYEGLNITIKDYDHAAGSKVEHLEPTMAGPITCSRLSRNWRVLTKVNNDGRTYWTKASMRTKMRNRQHRCCQSGKKTRKEQSLKRRTVRGQEKAICIHKAAGNINPLEAVVADLMKRNVNPSSQVQQLMSRSEHSIV
eukprot:6307880-Amphidinium_carterae.1